MASHPDPHVRMFEGGSAHGLVFAPDRETATIMFTAYMNAQHWDVTKINGCQEGDESGAQGRPDLEALLQRARKDGIAGKIVPAAFATDPGLAN